ncbi:MAG: LssY C-terminal domain-containing protein [Burkholderiales bacterium]
MRVSAVVLSPQETLNALKFPLAQKNIQPVWIEIENDADEELVLMLLSIDPEYFAPSEIAWMIRGEGIPSFNERVDLFLNEHIPILISPHTTVSGFVYTNLDPGAKVFAVELLGGKKLHSFEFAQLVPGFKADFKQVNFHHLYPESEIRDLDLESLRHYLEELPCCALGGDRETPGDPLNFVIVGDGRHVLATLVRRGWDLTETTRRATAWRTVASSLFGWKYRTSPVSPLYVFDRPQDMALQKARHSVDERNHLRLWLAPVKLNGEDVWVGQISRDIGVKFTTKTFVTHKIDPVVDEARLYITLDIAASQNLRAVGYVTGVGISDRDAPRRNYTNDPYYTDGLRAVLFLSKTRQPVDRIEILDWERPKRSIRSGSPPSDTR